MPIGCDIISVMFVIKSRRCIRPPVCAAKTSINRPHGASFSNGNDPRINVTICEECLYSPSTFTTATLFVILTYLLV